SILPQCPELPPLPHDHDPAHHREDGQDHDDDETGQRTALAQDAERLTQPACGLHQRDHAVTSCCMMCSYVRPSPSCSVTAGFQPRPRSFAASRQECCTSPARAGARFTSTSRPAALISVLARSFTEVSVLVPT